MNSTPKGPSSIRPPDGTTVTGIFGGLRSAAHLASNSAAENFVGATVSYVDGNITNAGNKTVTHVIVQVLFKDELGQLAQREDIPMQVLKTTGPYPEAVDFSVSPLGPGQSKTFRLTFESISAQWNRQYPEIQVTDVVLK